MTQLSTEQQKREVRMALFQQDEGPIYFFTYFLTVPYILKSGNSNHPISFLSSGQQTRYRSASAPEPLAVHTVYNKLSGVRTSGM